MDDGIEFFDSNILIAASIPEHSHHRESLARITAVQTGDAACGAHSLAEAYNNLTNKSRGYGIPPADAARIIQHATRDFNVIALTPTETLQTLDDASLHGIIGAMIYDALLLACARKANAKIIYTSNVKHFRRIAPDLAAIIVEP